MKNLEKIFPLTLFFLGSTQSIAEAYSEPLTLEEVTVTAQKREQLDKEVPIQV